MVKQFSPITINRSDLTPNVYRRGALATQAKRTTDPGTLIDIQLIQLGDKYEALFDDAVRTGRGDPTKIQTEYDRAKTGLTETRSKLGVQPRGRFSPPEFKSYVEHFKERGASAMVDPWGFWGERKKHADPEALKEQYFSARAALGYDSDLNTTEQKAFDLAWDQAMSSNKHTASAWKKLAREDPEVFTSRTYDARLLNIAAAKAKGISPMAKALRPKTKPAPAPQPIRQYSQSRGQTRVSYDGGRTWRIE